MALVVADVAVQSFMNYNFVCTRFRALKTVLSEVENREYKRADVHVANNNMIQL